MPPPLSFKLTSPLTLPRTPPETLLPTSLLTPPVTLPSLSLKLTPPPTPAPTPPPTSLPTPPPTPPPTLPRTPPPLSFKLTSPPTPAPTPPPTSPPPPLSSRSQMVRISSISSTSITPRCSTRVTGLLTRRPDHTITIAPSLSPITGRVPNNALSPGNAEALECAREEDGAPVSTVAKDPHSQPKLQVSPPPTERLIGDTT